MALERLFIGTSPGGDLTEAIRDALEKAKQSWDEDSAWEINYIAQNQLKLGPISVVILVGEGKGEGGGVGPR
jgi:hypothetical protein